MDAINVIVFILILVITYFVLFSKRSKTKLKWDERQEAVRNRGFKYGFTTMTIYNCLILWLLKIFNLKLSYDFLLIMPIMVGITVFSVYSIINGAYFSLNQNNLKRDAIIYLAVGIIELYMGIQGLLMTPREWDDHIIFLALGLFLLLSGMAQLYYNYRSRIEK
ncbi:DUF6442 family protein [Lactobacillus intestinalis]|uniref:DUF4181 domain-containing protein n=1 Tax=Lactobacillus intestinalis DSM 6629 TaxID=1423761 RepID=A0ABR5PP50_9LACO|nr:DUF6442 family protein [Lactobacillus intestinalis]KRM32234.1 hypothetical protein FC44_GL001652 [Lactobacillus intestinalis DSM 6629]UTW39981.1 hypothetical protein KBW87_06005 [Lactobacillus intestinalis]